jgi:hypothetical protein
MKRAYIKPVMFYGKEPAGLIPIVAAIAGVLGVSQAVAGLGLGAAAGLGAIGAGTAVAKKLGNDYTHTECLPSLAAVSVC